MQDLDYLNTTFGKEHQLWFEANEQGFIMVKMANQYGETTVSTYGGQVVSFCPAAMDHDMFFLSNKAVFSDGSAIRGGVPVCWPWFGDDTSGLGRPSHGFARNQLWKVTKTTVDEEGTLSLTLGLRDNEASLAVWPHAFRLELTVTLGQSLQLALTSYNTGDKAFTISQALHSYFNISHISGVSITGLKGKTYLDKLDNFVEKQQVEELTISQQTDRIYQQADQAIVLNDTGFHRNLAIESGGSRTTVVWNPWDEASQEIVDLESDHFNQFICIETANAAEDMVTIPEGASHTLIARYQYV